MIGKVTHVNGGLVTVEVGPSLFRVGGVVLLEQATARERARGYVKSVLVCSDGCLVYLDGCDVAYPVTRSAALQAAADDVGEIAIYSDGVIERLT